MRALGAGERDRSRAELGHEDPVQLALAVAEAAREAGHAVAVDEAVGDQGQGAAGDVGVHGAQNSGSWAASR